MHRLNTGYILATLAAIVTVGVAVKITDFSVPSSYVIGDEENPDPLILDCAYESEPNEKGIVLKWHLNGTLIYQWIPDSPPAHARTNIKPFIDTNYTVSDNAMQRHRALAIIKPMKNMTGEYTCEVGSFLNDDKRSKYLQMVVPESDLKLSVVEEYDNERGGDALSITCIAKNIYPEPKLTILPETGKFTSKSRYDAGSGLYSTTMFATVHTNQTSFVCLLNINGTDYQRSTNNSASDSSSTSPSAGNQCITTFIPLTLLSYITGIYLFTAIFH
ncbi:uncharacterized protein LOC129574956 [Sitodiplosis mosellana]|uniref:uncharacterized protein LOC129574956 n=1 Tax=Sitodiplosis mosellana TaxID=263140 RepID=UPI002444690C|nr:uncharacterized protein LOC129574956 [Sitodiplosis mosellana]XP_055313635.1 uncharacterized protein LOC129574956 [Sitodiplosis mosellana]XP_055313636.1 uncharacterized protein LOC129574956 [Sitodiplosis mosellana]XP_055313637.1 uncharacterized protein LOC129574956 [Sitodiplosis mosellana]XP_055313638.1 uncharacterized protein LOC129574956 [Sitodiplosis mosellana]XP_055313639.1 uncharacterized protein LOC129574956 [Sitodiplosis mosellana]XP_055313640.1 uncharacterized protein LOC129574956 [